jgi:hypothetical protein
LHPNIFNSSNTEGMKMMMEINRSNLQLTTDEHNAILAQIEFEFTGLYYSYFI